jgi:hypothetical protein
MVADLTAGLAASLAAQGGGGQNADAVRALQEARQAQQQAAQELRAAQQQAAQEAQAAQQQAAREVQRAQRDAERAIRDAQRQIAGATGAGQGVPLPPFPPGVPQIPEGAVIISVAFFIMCAFIAIGLPISRAIARRSNRGSLAAGGDADSRARLERIEQAVDAIAVEVERISEGQRFTTKVLADLRALPQPDPAAALAERDRNAAPLSRAGEAR